MICSRGIKSCKDSLLVAVYPVENYRQIHSVFKSLIREQICQKLILFEGEAKQSNINSTMRWWSKYISAAIKKTASRNIAFKSAKLVK